MIAIVVVIHVLAAFWLVTGIVGRDFTFVRAAKMTEIQGLRALVEHGRLFERTMVRPATFVVLILGLVAGWMRGWPILGSLLGGGSNWVFVSLLLFLSVIPLIFLVLLPRGRVFRKAYDAAITAGRVTPELTAALSDRAVNAARIYELAAIGVVTWLMVAKPF